MKNKYKLLLTALLSVGSFINVAAAAPEVSGAVDTKYTSDYTRRGELVSAEALQAQVGFNVGFESLDLFGDFFTNQSVKSAGADNDELTVGFGTSLFEDNLNAYAGVYNTDSTTLGENLEAFVAVGANALLSPKVTVYRHTDDDLYTFEGQVSHSVDLEVIDLELAGIIGNTDLSSTLDSTYFGAKVTANKSIKENLNIYADVSLSDNDIRSNETVWGLGLNVSF
jgi:hypothetical protein